MGYGNHIYQQGFEGSPQGKAEKLSGNKAKGYFSGQQQTPFKQTQPQMQNHTYQRPSPVIPMNSYQQHTQLPIMYPQQVYDSEGRFINPGVAGQHLTEYQKAQQGFYYNQQLQPPVGVPPPSYPKPAAAMISSSYGYPVNQPGTFPGGVSGGAPNVRPGVIPSYPQAGYGTGGQYNASQAQAHQGRVQGNPNVYPNYQQW
ncbi:hypothetical protein BB558_004362 [Smittium angustum]|nr:hypothetical protein BB558_004362 [Smittium angustum]